MVTEFMTTIVLWCAILLQRVEVRLTENRRSLAVVLLKDLLHTSNFSTEV